jgi:cytochrome c oxidase accessory protein FixG
MPATPGPVLAPERVLSTLNADGSRRWLRPRPSPGRFHRWRRAVAYGLMLIFLVIPYLRIGGRPAMLFDLPRREFSLFGTTFLATDTLLFMLLFVSAVIALFFLTALAGRIWCGWGCPQTVYMEFLFRPLERWIEGGPRGSQELDRAGGLHPRRLLKVLIYAGFALFLAHTFLAYFVAPAELLQWMRRSPVEHPSSFFVMLGTAALILFDFAYFREQTCLVACPYGRLQSVLLDRRSVIVGYDTRRGEPRMKGVKERPAGAGDCIDCRLCVLTCPTGIDIREGLQMECIHCTQCMDACDAVMARIGKPAGLIRYSSRDELEGRRTSLLRPRVVIYPAALAVTLGLFAWGLAARAAPDVSLLRGAGAPYALEPGGSVVNQVRIKITNRGRQDRAYGIELAGVAGASLIAPQNPFPVGAGKSLTTSVFVVAPRAAFPRGERPVTFRLSDGTRWRADFAFRLVGPEPDEDDREHADDRKHVERHGEKP